MRTVSKVNLYLSLKYSKPWTAHYHKVSPQHNINSTLIIAQIKRCCFFDSDSTIIETSISVYLIKHAPVISHLCLPCAYDHIKDLAVPSNYFEIETILLLGFYYSDYLPLPTISDYHTGLSTFLIYGKFSQ